MLDQQLMQTTIRDGVRALEKSADGELPKAFRIRLWKSFGPRRPEGSLALPAGPEVVARYQLERLCVAKALPIWQKRFPSDKTLTAVIACADQVLLDRSKVAAAQRRCDESWLFADNISASLFDLTPAKQYIAQVAYAASRLLAVAIADQSYNELDVDDSMYLAFNPCLEDPALSASCAISKGSPFETGSDNNLRRNFWRWYLRSAIPKAMKVLKSPS
jgi:hypothetical protein